MHANEGLTSWGNVVCWDMSSRAWPAPTANLYEDGQPINHNAALTQRKIS
jgi:hypothetical protein